MNVLPDLLNRASSVLSVLGDLAILGYVGFRTIQGARHLLAQRRRELERFRPADPARTTPAANFMED